MEMLDYENLKESCRLCLKPDGIKLPIFGEVGQQRDVAYKINVCFALAIYETDPLSKLICHRCLYKLDQIYEFRSEVLSAFQQLKKAMNLRRGDPVIDKYLSVLEDEMIVIGRGETCHSDNKHGSELTDETVNNNPIQPPGECLTFSGHTAGDQDEHMEIIQHIPFDAASAVNVHDVALDAQTINSSSEGNYLFIQDGNEKTQTCDELKHQAPCDNVTEGDNQETVPNTLVSKKSSPDSTVYVPIHDFEVHQIRPFFLMESTLTENEPGVFICAWDDSASGTICLSIWEETAASSIYEWMCMGQPSKWLHLGGISSTKHALLCSHFVQDVLRLKYHPLAWIV